MTNFDAKMKSWTERWSAIPSILRRFDSHSR